MNETNTTPPVVDNPTDNPTPVVDNWTEKWDESLFPEAQVNGPFYYALFLEEKLRRCVELVEWFSLKWGDDKDPLFPWMDEMTGQTLEGNIRLAHTWYEIVRHGTPCATCQGTRGRRLATDQERVFTFEPCDACGGRGFHPNEIDGRES